MRSARFNFNSSAATRASTNGCSRSGIIEPSG
jgi:hypothetical protein